MREIVGSAKAPEDISALAAKEGQKAEVSGAVHKIREMGGFAFIIIRTGRYLVQCVNESGSPVDISGLDEGFWVTVTGTVRTESRVENGFEILLDGVNVHSKPAAAAPVGICKRKLNLSIDTCLPLRPYTLRNPEQRAVFKVQEGVVSGFRGYMLENGFTEIHSPKIVKAGAEGGSNIFKLDYFGEKAYLAQSPQFYKQTMTAVFDRVFEIAPVYRAEKHNTTRHLNEYIGLDFEMAYIKDMYDIMDTETAMLKAVVEELKKNYSYELSMFGSPLPEITNIPAMTFMEVKETLAKIGKATKNRYDLEPAEEVALYEHIKKETGSEFVFITH